MGRAPDVGDPAPDDRRRTAEQVMATLRGHFPPEQYAFVAKVSSGTGANYGGQADAMVMGLWPSRGLLLQGFEVKVSRSDWLRELKDHRKADLFFRYCDRWWVVAGDSRVALREELPPRWGLMVVHGDGVRTAVHAEPLEPAPLNRAFLAALMRAAVGQLPAHAVRDAEYDRGLTEGRRQGTEQHNRLLEEYRALQGEVNAFQQASGIHISRWEGGRRLGEAVRLVARSDSVEMMRNLERQAQTVANVAREAREAAEAARDAGAGG